jgi:hypothetical protein
MLKKFLAKYYSLTNLLLPVLPRSVTNDIYPNFIYKYFSFDDNKHYQDILIRDSLYFSSPKYFNDPFDCSLDIKFRRKSKYFLANYLTNKILPYEIENISKETKMSAKTFIKNNFLHFDPSVPSNEKIHQKIQRDFVLSSGISCFSEFNNNILMWSHYSCKHTGFCVEFNINELIKALVNYNIDNKIDGLLSRVIYKSNWPYLSGYDKDPWVDSLYIKSSNWKYEKEWRIFLPQENGIRMTLPPNVVSAIYIGLQTEPEKEAIIKKATAAKSYKINIFKAMKVANKFALSFKKLN